MLYYLQNNFMFIKHIYLYDISNFKWKELHKILKHRDVNIQDNILDVLILIGYFILQNIL